MLISHNNHIKICVPAKDADKKVPKKHLVVMSVESERPKKSNERMKCETLYLLFTYYFDKKRKQARVHQIEILDREPAVADYERSTTSIVFEDFKSTETYTISADVIDDNHKNISQMFMQFMPTYNLADIAYYDFRLQVVNPDSILEFRRSDSSTKRIYNIKEELITNILKTKAFDIGMYLATDFALGIASKSLRYLVNKKK